MRLVEKIQKSSLPLTDQNTTAINNWQDIRDSCPDIFCFLVQTPHTHDTFPRCPQPVIRPPKQNLCSDSWLDRTDQNFRTEVHKTQTCDQISHSLFLTIGRPKDRLCKLIQDSLRSHDQTYHIYLQTSCRTMARIPRLLSGQFPDSRTVLADPCPDLPDLLSDNFWTTKALPDRLYKIQS